MMKAEEVGERIRAEKEGEDLKKLTDPRRPMQQETEDHNRTHPPHRSWCPRRLQARGKDLDQRKAIDEEGGLRSSASTTASLGASWGTS